MENIRLIAATIQYEKQKTAPYLVVSRPGTVYLTKSLVSHLNSGTCVWQSQGNKLGSFGSSWCSGGNSVVYAKGKFIVISGSGVVASSGDGISWSKIGNVGANCHGACFGNGYFASLANNDNFYYSSCLPTARPPKIPSTT
jgi:hypothetical protein